MHYGAFEKTQGKKRESNAVKEGGGSADL